MGIGRTYNAQERWQEAIEQFDKVIALYSDYSSGYSFRATSYIGLEDWQHATDDIITALAIDYDTRTFYIMQDLPQEGSDMLRVKLSIQCEKNPNDAYWPYCLGTIYESNKQYAKAITYYEESNRRDADDTALYRVSNCYCDLGDFQQALTYIDKALQLDPTDISYTLQRSYILRNLGHYDGALAEAEKCIQEYPDIAGSYIWRANVKASLRDYDGAVDDLSTAIILDPESAAAHHYRGDFYTQQGKTALAAEDYKRVIELEDTPAKYTYAMFAYQALGDNDQALAAMDTIISRSDDKRKDYYNAACLYSRMHNKGKALEYLTKAFDEGYNCFQHISADYDMDFLRDDDDFKSLVDKYFQQHKENLTHNEGEAEEGEEITTEVPFTKEYGVCHVECTINTLPLYFIFDTGAATISLSKVEADFMMKNGYLTGKDVVGSEYFSTATGSVSVGTMINLRTVEFGGLLLENVQASVVANKRAPLLLGQSVLGRLGKIEIDNNALLLRITHKDVNH